MENHIGYPLETIALFVAVVTFSVWLDLRLHRDGKDISIANATAWSLFWIFLAIAFYFYIKIHHGAEFAELFLAGYILEKSLSVDNLMVFVAIFASFGIKGALQHRILYFGILGAVLFRMIFIAFGTTLFGLSTWIEFLFAAIVAWTGWKMLSGIGGDDEIADYSDHWSVRMTQKLIPVYPRLHGDHFFVDHKHVETLTAQDPGLLVARKAALYATPMLLCLVVIEVSDIIFAFDSVPAIIAVTREPLLVYSAVIFAILGLRSLYFVLAAAQKYLVHLDKAVAALLFFIAFKLALQASNHLFHWPGFNISADMSLMIILGTLAVGVIASLLFPAKEEPEDKNVTQQAKVEEKIEARDREL
ncbi:MAG: TerC/Alx family metal homeostasis membrane protein [Candidatus Competibacteraceae bacterium]|nr:TerC/Alx family metal homeostasis membrane protein [Candidatus Competibacteraceae bacterium]